MKLICVFLGVTLFVSCEFFNVKKTSSEAILQEELKTFNWKDVDVYPSFPECDSLETNAGKRSCFSKVLTTHILEYLQREMIVVTKDINDTINLKFKISESGALTLVDAKMDSLTTSQVPNLLTLINNSLDTLPEIYPAIKRGQQVKTEFNLPLIIHVD